MPRSTHLATNVLSYGDTLDVLRRYSNRDDNVIFRDESGNATDAQLLAFEA
jgi:hypothetical protein